MLVTLPFVLLLLDCWPLGRWTETRRQGDKEKSDDRDATTVFLSPCLLVSRSSLRWLIVEKLPLFALVAGTVVLTLKAQSVAITSMELIPWPSRLANALMA